MCVEQQERDIFLRRMPERIQATGRIVRFAGEAAHQESVVEGCADHARGIARDALQGVESTGSQETARVGELATPGRTAHRELVDIRQRWQFVHQGVAEKERDEITTVQFGKRVAKADRNREELFQGQRTRFETARQGTQAGVLQDEDLSSCVPDQVEGAGDTLQRQALNQLPLALQAALGTPRRYCRLLQQHTNTVRSPDRTRHDVARGTDKLSDEIEAFRVHETVQ